MHWSRSNRHYCVRAIAPGVLTVTLATFARIVGTPLLMLTSVSPLLVLRDRDIAIGLDDEDISTAVLERAGPRSGRIARRGSPHIPDR